MNTFVLEAPCADCVHIKVCALKTLLEIQAQKVERAQPVWDPDLSARLTVEVDCAHFLPETVRQITAVAAGIPLEAIDAAQTKESIPVQSVVISKADFDAISRLPRPEPELAAPSDEARTDFNARAKAKLDASWRSTHQVDEAPPPATDPLTHHQRRVLETVMRLDGDRKAAAEELGVVYQSVDGALEHAGRRGQLPVELIAKLPARFAQYAAVPA